MENGSDDPYREPTAFERYAGQAAEEIASAFDDYEADGEGIAFLIAPIARFLGPPFRELEEALLEALTQGCHDDDGVFDTMALSAYRSGWDLCVRLGIAEVVEEGYGRRGFYRPLWEKLGG